MNDYNVRNLIYAEIPEIKRNIRDLQETNEHLRDRISNLEEKERQRSAKENQLPYEEWCEGIEALEYLKERRGIEPTTMISPSQDTEIDRIVDEVLREEHDRDMRE